MAIKVNKKTKIAEARKMSEALKAKKKQNRDSKAATQITISKPGTKGKSLVGQAKKKK